MQLSANPSIPLETRRIVVEEELEACLKEIQLTLEAVRAWVYSRI